MSRGDLFILLMVLNVALLTVRQEREGWYERYTRLLCRLDPDRDYGQTPE